MPLPHLRAYPPETAVVEKLQALVALGQLNSRMKDFFDLWAISETFDFAGSTLTQAIRGNVRATRNNHSTPNAYSPDSDFFPAIPRSKPNSAVFCGEPPSLLR